MKRLRFLCAICFAVLTLSVAVLPVCATTESGVLPQEEWDKFESAIPDSVRDKLADGSDENADGFAEGVSEMSKGSYFVSVILDMVGVELDGALKLFFCLCAIVIVSSVFSALGADSENSALLTATRFCSIGGIISVVLHLQYSHFEMLEDLLLSLGTMMNGMVPMTACLWAMGGNVGTASVGGASFTLLISVSQSLLSHTLIPVCSALTVFGFCDALGEEMRMGKMMSAIKKIYNFVLVLVMTVLLSSLAAQTTLAASADSTAARTARLVSGTVIPVLGGSVGETFRTVAAGVSYLKNVFGIGSIIMIVLLVLPVVITLLLTRFAFLMSAGFANMLGCSAESRALENLGEVYGTMLAVVSGVGVMFVIALCVFIQSSVAVA